MAKLLKSEHLNEELWKAEKEINEASGDALLRIIAKIVILNTKLMRDIRHNQVEIMKANGVNLTVTKNKEVSNDA